MKFANKLFVMIIHRSNGIDLKAALYITINRKWSLDYAS